MPSGGHGGDSDTVREVAARLNLPEGQVESLRTKKVATVVPRAFGLEVVDRTDPLYKIDPRRARSRITHLLTANTELPADTGPQGFATVANLDSTFDRLRRLAQKEEALNV